MPSPVTELYSNNQKVIPKRKIPLLWKLGIFFNSRYTWVGLVFSVPVIAVFIKFILLSISLVFHLEEPIHAVNGKLLNLEYGKFSKNGQLCYKYIYEYEVHNKQYAGISYSKIKIPLNSIPVVTYTEPQMSVIKGMENTDIQNDQLIFAFLFTLIRVGLIIYSYILYSSELALLKYGQVAQASIYRIIGRRSTRDKEDSLFEVYVKFTTNDGKEVDTVIRTDQNKTQYEDRLFPIIYLPSEPTKAMFLISLSREKINFIYNN